MAWIRTRESSQIHSMQHDPVDEALSVRFICYGCRGSQLSPEGDRNCPKCDGNGFSSHYKYQNVDPETYASVRDADSVGNAFNTLIKKRPDRFPYQKVA